MGTQRALAKLSSRKPTHKQHTVNQRLSPIPDNATIETPRRTQGKEVTARLNPKDESCVDEYGVKYNNITNRWKLSLRKRVKGSSARYRKKEFGIHPKPTDTPPEIASHHSDDTTPKENNDESAKAKCLLLSPEIKIASDSINHIASHHSDDTTSKENNVESTKCLLSGPEIEIYGDSINHENATCVTWQQDGRIFTALFNPQDESCIDRTGTQFSSLEDWWRRSLRATLQDKMAQYKRETFRIHQQDSFITRRRVDPADVMTAEKNTKFQIRDHYSNKRSLLKINQVSRGDKRLHPGTDDDNEGTGTKQMFKYLKKDGVVEVSYESNHDPSPEHDEDDGVDSAEQVRSATPCISCGVKDAELFAANAEIEYLKARVKYLEALNAPTGLGGTSQTNRSGTTQTNNVSQVDVKPSKTLQTCSNPNVVKPAAPVPDISETHQLDCGPPMDEVWPIGVTNVEEVVTSFTSAEAAIISNKLPRVKLPKPIPVILNINKK